jgi:hypothetical protein
MKLTLTSGYDRAEDREWKDAPGGVKYVQFSTQPGNADVPLVVLSKLPPHHVEPPHTHDCNYIEIVMDGTLTVGKADAMRSGDVRSTSAGVGYGPLVAGEDGCVRLTIFERAGGSMMRLLGKAASS